MNIIIFLGGLGTGAVITTFLFMHLIHRLVSKRSKEGEKVDEWNKSNYAELKRRNDIGERQASSLQTIASWCENNWNRNS